VGQNKINAIANENLEQGRTSIAKTNHPKNTSLWRSTGRMDSGMGKRRIEKRSLSSRIKPSKQ